MRYQESSPGRKKDTRAMVIGGLLIILVGAWLVIRHSWNKEDVTTESLPSQANNDKEENKTLMVTAESVRQKMLNGDTVRFLDVRGEESFQREHIPHSLPLSTSSLGTYTPEPNEFSVIVFSTKDTRTLEVIKNILKQKSVQLFLLEGGIEEWKKKGNPTVAIGDPTSFIDQSKITYITPEAAATVLSQEGNNVFILDVQTEQNYQKKHIQGAKNIPLDQLEKRSGEIPPAKRIIVYGDSELLSFQGGVRLADLGVFTAQTVSGNKFLEAGSPFSLEP